MEWRGPGRAPGRDLEEAVRELNVEVDRLKQNIQEVTQYQASVFQVTKVLCSWMDNIKELAKHRQSLHLTSDPSK